jgi:hypothetical protein
MHEEPVSLALVVSASVDNEPNGAQAKGEKTGIYASLRRRAATTEANDLVTRLSSAVEAEELRSGNRKYRRGPKQLIEHRHGVEAFLGDLLRAVATEHAKDTVYRSLKRGSFTGEAVSYRTFANIVAVFQSVGFIKHTAGRQFFIRNPFAPPTAPPVRNGGHASRFKATNELIQLCINAAVTPQDARKHFVDPLPEHPLVLKGLSKAGRRQAAWV